MNRIEFETQMRQAMNELQKTGDWDKYLSVTADLERAYCAANPQPELTGDALNMALTRLPGDY